LSLRGSLHTGSFYKRAATSFQYSRETLPKDYAGRELREAFGVFIGRAQIAARDTSQGDVMQWT